MSAFAVATKEKTNEELCTLIAQVMDILHKETKDFKNRSKQKRLVKRLKSAGLSPQKQHTGDFLWAYNWITNKFNMDKYNDKTKPSNTGKGLIALFYYNIVGKHQVKITFKEREAYQIRSEARKAAYAKIQAAKRAVLREQKKVSIKKKMAKEKQERLRLGGGDEELGTKRFQERMSIQSAEKDRKAAIKVSGDAQKLLDFWTWRLQTEEGKGYDAPLRAASFKSIYASYVCFQSTKRFMLKSQDAVQTLRFLLNGTGVPVKNPKITFKDDSIGKIHFYGMCIARDDGRQVALHYKKMRKTPATISGSITGCKLLSNGEFYIQTKHTRMNTLLLLPPKWNDFKSVADKVIGYKRYKAQPNQGVDIPFMFKVLDPTAIKTLEWTNGNTKYVATVDAFGKDLTYVKSLCKTQAEAELVELLKMKTAADAQKQEKKQRAIQKEHEKESQRCADAWRRDALKRAPKSVHKFCTECGKGVLDMKFCQSCGTKTG